MTSELNSYTIFTSNVANIVINECDDIENDNNTYTIFQNIKTAVSQRSIFYSDEEIGSDENT